MQVVSDQIYFREFDPQGNDALSKMAQRIVPGASVLDLGCGPGILGSRLVQDKRCVVDGVEGNPDAAALAVPRLRRVVVADLEAQPVAAIVGGERYDYIICADVLEHLRRPEKLLAQLGELLTPSGRILLSIPNVSYAGLVGALVNGEFRYRPEGLLDATHLRFFTRSSLRHLFESCGLEVTHADVVSLPINDSEFGDDRLERLPPAVMRTLLANPDALTYQFVTELAPPGRATVVPFDAPASAPAFTFVAQLHYRYDGAFDADRCITIRGEMAAERQQLRFAIPAAPASPTGLRLDPTNRAGYVHLFAMTLLGAGGERLWRWDGAALDGIRSQQLSFVRDADDAATILVCEGDDPWLELPIPPSLLARLSGGGTLEVEVSWPQSHDTFAVMGRLRAAQAENRELQRQLREQKEALARITGSLTFRLSRPLFALANRLRGPR